MKRFLYRNYGCLEHSKMLTLGDLQHNANTSLLFCFIYGVLTVRNKSPLLKVIVMSSNQRLKKKYMKNTFC